MEATFFFTSFSTERKKNVRAPFFSSPGKSQWNPTKKIQKVQKEILYLVGLELVWMSGTADEWVCIDFYWVFIEFDLGLELVFMSFTSYEWVLGSITGFYWLWMSLIQFHRILSSFSGFL